MATIDLNALYNDLQGSAKASFTGKTINLNPRKEDTAETNRLHSYASYNYVWTLSALSQDDLRKPEKIKREAPHDVIAKSSGIGPEGKFSAFNSEGTQQGPKDTVDNQDNGTIFDDFKAKESYIKSRAKSDQTLRRSHDIFFEKVLITAVHRTNEQRKMMNFTKIEMIMHEPYGVTLFEKLKAAAFNNKFLDHIDAPYLLTLEFRGYDNIGNPLKTITTRKLPIKITNAEMEINAGGVVYTMNAVPWTEFAMTDRYLYIRGSGNIFGNTEKAGTLPEAMKKLADVLNKQQTIEVDKQVRELPDEYEIKIQDSIPTSNSKSWNFNLSNLTGTKFPVSVRPNESIAKVIADCVQKADGFRNVADVVKKYWIEIGEQQESKYKAQEAMASTPSKEPYVPWFKIVTNVETKTETIDQRTGMYPKKITFTVIPYAVHVMNFTLPGLSASPLWGKTVKKRFNYIYTGKNDDILDLKINYKFGFFQAALVDGTGADGSKTGDIKDLSFQDLYTRYGSLVKDQPEALLPLRRYPSYNKSADASSGKSASTTQVDEFYEYLTAPMGDMVNVQMTILGDPAFIGQDFALPYQSGGSAVKIGEAAEKTLNKFTTTTSSYAGNPWDDELGCFNFDQAEPFVTLDFRFPTDINETKGVMNFENLENIVFSGLYKVVQVESVFDSGKFTQVLDLVRFNNQGKQMTAVTTIQEQERRKKAADAKAKFKAVQDSLKNRFDPGPMA